MKVPLQIVFRNMDHSEAIATWVRERAEWLERYNHRVISCRVAIEMPHRHHHRGNVFRVRVGIRIPRREIVISREPGINGAHKDLYVTLRDAFDEARRELEDHARKRRQIARHPERVRRARVARLIRGDGDYGFLTTEDGRELYFHSRSVLEQKFDLLEVGMEVRYAEEMGEDGPQASTVELLLASRKVAP